ncbi:MAG: cryptochrome/photolyase family protein, partial [Pseudomonadales bacterium]|nr:cryptochrome/photolyase family protein [Pseudomonadales bacterium]
KHVRMETFYRKMRKRFGILMDDGEPEGGRWNFDAENRNKLNKDALSKIPPPLLFENNVEQELVRLDRHKVEHFGRRKRAIGFPINRGQALQLLEYFCCQCLTNFGRYQDAMTCQSDYDWSLYHSRLSFALNAKLISPTEVINQVVATYQQNEAIDLAQTEGFVRQILGWREYVRGVYWVNMPGYEQLNALHAKTRLPDYFWTGETDMNCMHHAIRNSLDHAHAHHIQRLMVTGNFSLLAGLDLNQVDAWYLGIYADALQWVELPNTRGMALYGDGGIVGTKPYAASSNYINKMSDYCKSCKYQTSRKHGEGSCPFNSLYWHFMHRHRERFAGNQRMSMLYRTWDRMDPTVQEVILQTASGYLDNIESL